LTRAGRFRRILPAVIARAFRHGLVTEMFNQAVAALNPGPRDPLVRLIDFDIPENNHFLAINQFRIDTPGAVRQFVIVDIMLFVNGIPLAVVEC